MHEFHHPAVAVGLGQVDAQKYQVPSAPYYYSWGHLQNVVYLLGWVFFLVLLCLLYLETEWLLAYQIVMLLNGVSHSKLEPALRRKLQIQEWNNYFWWDCGKEIHIKKYRTYYLLKKQKYGKYFTRRMSHCPGKMKIDNVYKEMTIRPTIKQKNGSSQDVMG